MPALPALAALSLVFSGAVMPLQGRVVDARTGQPIVGVEIAIAGHRGVVHTDEDGRFRWPAAPSPPFDVIAILPDGRVGRPIHVTSIDQAHELTLAIEAVVTETIAVTGTAPTIATAPGASATLLTSADLDLRHPSTVSQALETVPGVSFISEGQAAVPAIRGLARGRTLILVDGSRASTERRAGANASFLDPATMRTIEVARSAGSVAYGSDAFGGVIAARTRGPEYAMPLGVRFSGSVGGGVPERRGDLELSAGYGSGGVLVGVRAREFEDYNSPAGVVPNSGWRDQGVRLRWDHGRAAGRWSIGWQSDLGRDLGRPRSDSDVVRATSPYEDSHRLTVSYERAALAGWRHLRIAALAGTSRQRTDQDRLPTSSRPRNLERADLSWRDMQVRLTSERTIGRARLHVGADVQGRYALEATDTTIAYDLAGVVVSSTPTVSIESAHRTAVGLFGEGDVELMRRAQISGGLRVDAVRSTNTGGFFGDQTVSNVALAGLVAATVSPTRRLTVTGQVARGFRDPILSDRFYRGPVGRGFIQGNPELEPETSLQLDLTARYLAGRLRLGAAGYRYRIGDLIERYASGPNLFLLRNRSRALLRGAEVEAQVSLARGLAVEATAEISRGRDAGDATALDDVAPGAVSAIVRHALGDRLTSYLRVKRITAHDAAGPSEVPTSAYTLVDAGASWRVTRQLAVRGVLRNLLDESYQSSAGPRWVWAPGRHGSVTVVVTF